MSVLMVLLVKKVWSERMIKTMREKGVTMESWRRSFNELIGRLMEFTIRGLVL